MIHDAVGIVLPMCVRFEGVYLRPYICPAGVVTIGVGATRYLDGRKVRMTDPPITREHALTLLRASIERDYMPAVLALCQGVDTPGRLAALTDFAFNCGIGSLRASTLRKRINAGDWDRVPQEFAKWTSGGGKVLPGLVKRRKAEIALL